jgi:hypothetical protein
MYARSTDMKMKTKILLLEPIHEDGISVLRQFADLRLAQDANPPS